MDNDEGTWPALPTGCPGGHAQPHEGIFYRLVNGGADDWRNHVQIHGEAKCGTNAQKAPKAQQAAKLCEFHALSVLGTLEAAVEYREQFNSLRGRSIGRFRISKTLGVLHENKPQYHHLNWWPHGSDFVGPPADFELVVE